MSRVGDPDMVRQQEGKGEQPGCAHASALLLTPRSIWLSPHTIVASKLLFTYTIKELVSTPCWSHTYISWQVPLVKLVEPAGQKHKLQPATLFSCMYGVVVSFMHWILQQSMTTDSSLTTDTPQLLTLSFSRWIYSHAQVTWIEYKSVLKE